MKTQTVAKAQQSWFTQEEYKRLVLAAIKGRSTKGATKEQIKWFVERCERMRFEGMMANLIAGGKMTVEITGDSPDNFDLGAVTALP